MSRTKQNARKQASPKTAEQTDAWRMKKAMRREERKAKREEEKKTKTREEEKSSNTQSNAISPPADFDFYELGEDVAVECLT